RVVMIRFSLLHPSRGRLERAAQAIGEWTARRSGDHSVEHILSVDTDDDVAGYRRVADAAGVRLVVNANRSVVDAANAAARAGTVTRRRALGRWGGSSTRAIWCSPTGTTASARARPMPRTPGRTRTPRGGTDGGCWRNAARTASAWGPAPSPSAPRRSRSTSVT